MSFDQLPPPPAQDLNHKQLKALAKASRPWYLKKRIWALGLVAVIAIAGAAGSSSGSKDKDALPAGSDNFPTESTTVQAGATETPVTEAPKVTPTTEAPAASSCDVVREALLTGTQADIDAAMAQLQADKTADATAREYADYYLHRDAGDQGLRDMDVSLIRMSCSI